MVYSVFLWRKGFREDNRVTYFLLLLACVFHTTAMVKRGFSLQRCPVNNLYEATLFIAWTIVAAYLVFGFWSRLRFLGAFASPMLFVMGVFALMPDLDKAGHGLKPEFVNGWSSLHGALILLSFGAFGLGSVAALMYLTQEHDLKFHKLRAILSLLPPIQRLEKVASGLVLAGFVLLTAGLSIYPMLHQAAGASFRLDPIILWSLFVWMLYLFLLVMRWRGQGGRRFAWGALGSFAFILLTFWGVILLSPLHNS
ncbi:MAG: Cytochrome c assembly protein [Pedosphaera sp.]|nr:Cytochrome c assembly protein [Pedosphaera sp.]